MKRMTIAILLLLLTATHALATAQAPDILLYDGEAHSIFTNPLESYFDDQHPRPNEIFEASCTAIWRGYIATWKIEENMLHLVKLVEGSCSGNAPEIPLDKVFPKKQAPIKALWFSGTLLLPQGEVVNYVHMGYGSTYERYILITVAQGIVRNIFKFDYDEYIQFRKKQFAAYKKTPEYRKKAEELRTSGEYSEELIEEFLFHADAEYYLSLEFPQDE